MVAEDKGCEDDARLRHLGGARRGQLRRRARPRRATAPASTIEVLSGEDEARLTFLAVRRWFGWSAGRLAVFDIGGGSLEIAGGADEAPDVAWSLPLGAARLARDVLRRRPARRRGDPRSCASRSAPTSPATPAACCAPARRDRAAATSKTFRSLARICGAAPSGDGPLVAAVARRSTTLREWIPKLVAMTPEELADAARASRRAAPTRSCRARWSPRRCMDIFDLAELEICPWALREGVILERIDQISVGDAG